MKIANVSDRILFLGCFLLWLLIQSVLFIKFGAQTSVDSEFYLGDAMNLLNGQLPEGRSIWYVSYSAFLALTFFCGGNNGVVVFVQILLSGVATFCLYQIAMEMYGKRDVAILAVLFYLLWIKIHEWNTFLYTESLFTSCSIISFAILIKSKRTWRYVLACLLFFFTFFIRPTGFALLVGLFCYGVFSLRREYLNRVILPLGFIGAISMVILLAGMVESFALIESYAKAEIIYPNITLGMEASSDLYIPKTDHSTFLRVFLFAFYNPVYFLKLFFLKLFLFLGNVKPYFSVLHNAVIVLVLYPLYVFAVKGFLKFPPHRKEKYFVAGFVIAQALTVALTSENWDGRFLVPLLPFVFLLAANGVVAIFKLSTENKA
jgi:Dolichyl-phosphate-mannose-protein mannosyltransferase